MLLFVSEIVRFHQVASKSQHRWLTRIANILAIMTETDLRSELSDSAVFTKTSTAMDALSPREAESF